MQFQLEHLKCRDDHLHFRSFSHTWSHGLQDTNTSKCNLHQFEYIWSLNLNSLSNQLQLKCDKLKLNHINTINIIMCLCIVPYVDHFVCIVCSNRGGAGTRDHPLRWRPRYRNLVSKASSPPLIMSIKTHLPLYLLCMNRMITLCRFLPHSWTHILCMAYHLVTVVRKPQP